MIRSYVSLHTDFKNVHPLVGFRLLFQRYSWCSLSYCVYVVLHGIMTGGVLYVQVVNHIIRVSK